MLLHEIGNEESLLKLPTETLLSEFASGKASPGSGSAAALMGLLSSSIIVTVCSKSNEKIDLNKNMKSKRDHIYKFTKISNNISSNIQPALTELFESDARDFDLVVKYRRERNKWKSDPNRHKFYSQQETAQLDIVTGYTLCIAELCLELFDAGEYIYREGWKHIKGDSSVSISAAIAGISSSLFISKMNLDTLNSTTNISLKLEKYEALLQQFEHRKESSIDYIFPIKKD